MPFESNTADRSPLAERSLPTRFRLEDLALDGDCRMVVQTRVGQDLKPVGRDWITAVHAPTISKLALHKYIQPSGFDSQGKAAATTPGRGGQAGDTCQRGGTGTGLVSLRFR